MSGKSFLQRWGIVEDTPAAPAVAPAAPAVPGSAMGVTAFTPTFATTGAVQADDSLFAALLTNINAAVTPNSLITLGEMADTMKSAIQDEGTRVKAAAAACRLTFNDVNSCIDALVAALQNEKQKFIDNDVKQMDTGVSVATQDLEQIKADIESTLAHLNELTAQRDALAADITQKQDKKNVTVAIFETTVNKVLAELEGERNKIKVYVPQVVPA